MNAFEKFMSECMKNPHIARKPIYKKDVPVIEVLPPVRNAFKFESRYLIDDNGNKVTLTELFEKNTDTHISESQKMLHTDDLSIINQEE